MPREAGFSENLNQLYRNTQPIDVSFLATSSPYLDDKNKLTESKAKIIRQQEETNKEFKKEFIENLFTKKEATKTGKSINIPKKIIDMYFEDVKDKEIEETIIAALDSYFGN